MYFLPLFILDVSAFDTHSTVLSSDHPFKEIEVEFVNHIDGTELAGTLCLPVPENKVPAVLLIQGSGPHDRNEEILGHPLFKVIKEETGR